MQKYFVTRSNFKDTPSEISAKKISITPNTNFRIKRATQKYSVESGSGDKVIYGVVPVISLVVVALVFGIKRYVFGLYSSAGQ